MLNYIVVAMYTLFLGAVAVRSNVFGRGSHRIVASSVGCNGAETQLSSCSNLTVSLSSGTSYQTYTPAGVICQGINTLRSTKCSPGDVRLVNGSRETEGRVEVCAYGYWAIVCDSNWNIAATRLVCKQLGLPTEGICIHTCMVYYCILQIIMTSSI